MYPKILPEVRGGAQRAEGSVKSLDYVKPLNSVIPLTPAGFIQSNNSYITDPLRNKLLVPLTGDNLDTSSAP